MATVKQVIDRAARLLGVKSSDDDLTTTEYTDCLYVLNEILAGWSIERLIPVSRREVSASLVSGTGSYAIGSGATIDTDRPDRIESAFVRDSSGYDSPLTLMTKADYDAFVDKDVTGEPEYLYYDTTYPNGVLYLYPVPDAVYTLVLTAETPFVSYTATTDTIALPPEFSGLLAYQLGINMSPEFRIPIPQELALRYSELMRSLKISHTRTPNTLNAMPFKTNTYLPNIYGAN